MFNGTPTTRRRLSRRRRRLIRTAQAVAWQRRVLRGTDIPATRRLAGDRGAVLVEYALILPLAVLLSVTGLFYGLGVLDSIRLERAATEAVHASHEDTAGDLIAQAGGSMACYWAGDGPGGCFPDDLDGLPRVQVVAEGNKTYQPPLGSKITPTAHAVALREETP